MTRLALLAAASLALSGPAAAHDIWLTPDPGGVLIHYGHPHQPELLSADKLMSLTAYEAAGTVALSAKIEPGSAPVLRAALAWDALVSATYDNGYWVRLPDGSYRNGSKRTMPQADRRVWSVKFAKAALGPPVPWDRVVGQPLEIVPLEAPATAKDKIRVRVLFEGKPLAGADVTATDGVTHSEAEQAHAITGADGVVTVLLRVAGPQVLGVAHHVAPSETPALAVADTYSATFAFTVADPKTN